MWSHRYFYSSKKPIGSRFFISMLGLVVICSAVSVKAQTNKTLTLKQAVGLTLQQHPDLAVFADKMQEHQGYILQSSVNSRALVSAEIEDVLGTGSLSNINSAQTTISISWVLENDLVARRVKAAESAASSVGFDKEIKALDLAAQTASLYVECLVLQQRLKLAEQAKAQEQQILNLIERRMAAGSTNEIEKLQVQANLVRLDLAVEDLEHELDAAIYRLTAQWQGQQDDYVLSGDLFAIPAVTDFNQQLKQLVEHPQIQAFANQERILQSAIELAEVEKQPRWQLSAGLRRIEATDDFGWVAGVSIPLGEDSSAKGAVAALQARQAQQQARQQALTHQIKTQLYVLLQEISHSRHVIETLSDKVVPLQNQALSSASKAYEMGKSDYMQWSAIKGQLLETRAQLLHAYHAIHLQNIELQRLTGVSATD